MNKEELYKAQPQNLPRPTYWPFFMAFGVVCLFWGILTNWVVSAVGLILFGISLAGWISDIFNELKNN